MSETHLEKESTLNCPGYISYVNNRQEKHRNAPKASGGVAFLVKTELYDMYSFEIVDKAFDGIMGLSCRNKETGHVAIIYVCYLPPQNSPWGRDATSFFAHLVSELYINGYADSVLLAGDFNSRIGNISYLNDFIDRDIPARTPIDLTKAGHWEEFIDFVKDTRLTILNGCINPENDNYTNIKRGKSVVDYMMIPQDCLSQVTNFRVDLANTLVEKCGACNLIGDSSKVPDHSMLTVNLQCGYNPSNNTSKNNNSNNNDESGQKYKLYRFQNLNSQSLNSPVWQNALRIIIDRLLSDCHEQSVLDDLYDSFCGQLFSELDNCLGYKYVSKKSKKYLKNAKPYWNETLQVLWNEMVAEEKSFSKYRGNNRNIRSDLFVRHKNSQKKFDKALRSASRTYNRQVVEEVEKICVDNHKEFWNKIKCLGPRKQSNGIPMTVRTEGDNLSSDKNTVLHKWKSDFSELLNQGNSMNNFDDSFYDECITDKASLENDMHLIETDSNCLLNADMTQEEITIAISKLKNKKAVGIDLIPNEVIKCTGIQIALHTLFQRCFVLGIVPSIWQKSIIKPIPKGSAKDPYVPLNYRGISLISCISKVYSSVLNKRIVKFCNSLGIFPDEQNGFRSGRSCEDHIFSVTSIIKNRLSDKKDTFCAFVDLEKAFDWVNRDLLLYRLLQNNITGKMYYAVKSILCNTKSCVQLDKFTKTDWFDNKCGVRQGDNLSPTLFSLYINDLAKTLKENGPFISVGDLHINILLYADDMVLIADNENDLQTLLDIMHKWCMKWRLSVNKEKTEIVHFRPTRRKLTRFTFTYGSEQLNIASSYKYLGIILDEHLKYDVCVKTLASSGGRALGAIIAKFRSLKGIGYSSFSKMYVAGVQPILEYASGVWGYIKSKEIDYIQNRAFRYFLGVNRFSPIAGMAGDMGWISHTLGRYLCMMRLWNRLINMPNDRLTKKVFAWDREMANGWCSEIKKVFRQLDLLDNYNENRTCDLKNVKTKLTTIMKQNWSQDVNGKPKLRTYKLFKNDFITEKYVHINNRQNRSVLAQFRLGVLPLRIETGRWYNGIDLENRTCEICKNGEIEDECHFLIRCNYYSHFRQTLFEKCCNIDPNFQNFNDTEKMIFIVNNIERDLANFLVTCWKARRTFLYNQ